MTFEIDDNSGIDVLKNLTGSGESSSCIRNIFVDEEGHTWGAVGYLYGCRDSWFCLDAPDGEDFPVRAVAEPEITPAKMPVLPAKGYAPYILVALVVGATGGILAFFYGKRRKSTK